MPHAVGESVTLTISNLNGVEEEGGQIVYCPKAGVMAARYDYYCFDKAAFEASCGSTGATLTFTVTAVGSSRVPEDLSGQTASPAGGIRTTYYQCQLA
jgi:hypothetical protein